MVDAAQFPGPALWQGLMLLLLPVALVLATCWKDGDRLPWVFGGYIAVGFALFLGIVLA